MYFAFVSDVISKKLLPNVMSWNFPPMLSSKNFRVLGLLYRSLIHFELNLYMVYDNVPASLVWICLSSNQDTIFWKVCLFPIEWPSGPWQPSSDHMCDGLLLGSYSIPVVYMSVFMPAHCFDDCSFVVIFEIGKCECSVLLFFFKIVLDIRGVSIFHMNFRITIYSINFTGILMGIALSL